MSLSKATLLAVLALTSFGPSAQAAFQSQVMNFPSSTPPFMDPLTFAKFNTNLGTLTAVTIIVTENASLTSSAVNVNTNTVAYSNAGTSGTVMVSGPDGTVVTSTLSTVPVNGSIAGSTIVPVQLASVSGSSSTTSGVAPSGFGAYQGAGAGLTYTVFANGSYNYFGSSAVPFSIFFGGSASVGGSVEIDYTYTAFAVVPEPASFALVALGMGGVLAVRRTRRRAV